MSGPAALPSLKVNDQVCQALAKVIADAKRGNVECVGVVAVSPSGQPMAFFAGEADLTPSVNLGLDMLKATIMAQILGGQSKILRPDQVKGQ
jgi:hypothetical protein